MLELILYGVFAVTIIGLVADWITTVRAMSAGYSEQNPLAAWFVEKLGITRGIRLIVEIQVVILTGLSLFFWYAPDFIFSLVLRIVPDLEVLLPKIFVDAGKTFVIFTFLAYYGFLHWKAAFYNRKGYT